jgi:Zn-dependent protease with chaperone function
MHLKKQRRHALQKTFVAFCLTLLLSVNGLAKTELKPGWNLFSKEQDVQLGREAAAQVEQQMPIVGDAALNRYVQEIGQRLANTPEARQLGNYPYTFKVVNDNNINAFALPGGPTYVNTGLIRAAENEAQLAGVMAHEIAHVALRHGTNQASKANMLQIPAMILGGVVGGGGSLLGQLAQVGVGLGLNGVLLKYSRDAERQADLLGAQMLASAGYNPLEMARFFEKLAAQGGGSRAPSWFSSHPDPGDRMELVQKEIQSLPQRNYTLGDNRELNQVQARLGSLPANQTGSRARVVGDGNPTPSGRMATYNGREFSLAHPDNWESFGDSNSAMVTIAPRSGLVQDSTGNVAVAYGVMASYLNRHGEPPELRRDTQDLIAQLRQSNPAMQVTGRQQNIRVNGAPGLVTTLYNQSPLGGREVNMLVTADRPEGLFYAIFIAPDRDWKQLQPVYERMLSSLKFR